MKEKIRAFFQNEKVKRFGKRVFNKKTITGAVILLVIVIALRITFSLVFEVEGTVKKVEGSKITVVNFLTTKTVDIGDFQNAASGIQVGDRIEIMKNLSGEVISVRDGNRGHIGENKAPFNNGRGSFKGPQQRNSMRRH